MSLNQRCPSCFNFACLLAGMTVQVSVLKMKESTFIMLLYDKYSHNILKDKSSAWLSLVLQPLERFTVKNA